jgi:hypothetical protein
MKFQAIRRPGTGLDYQKLQEYLKIDAHKEQI